jgi:deazaflavin-dependent oxidoreductase (nitroreductase family)
MPIQEQERTWNRDITADFRAHGGQITQGPLTGANVLLLTSTGVKSGEPRLSPLGYTRDGDRYVVVASNSGRDAQPAWIANILANPSVDVEVGTERFKGAARITDGDERARLWAAHKAAIPMFGTYETMTTRELPVVVVERATA